MQRVRTGSCEIQLSDAAPASLNDARGATKNWKIIAKPGFCDLVTLGSIIYKLLGRGNKQFSHRSNMTDNAYEVPADALGLNDAVNASLTKPTANQVCQNPQKKGDACHVGCQ